MLGIPWGKRSKVKKDLNAAQTVLDNDHFGLDKVKERIVEYLAVQQRANKLTGPILCLVGPPGVGKTFARQVDCTGDGSRICAHVARRRAGRSGDSRSPAHLYRVAARQDHTVHAQGQDGEPAHPARRDRQDGAGFPGGIPRRRCWKCSIPSRTRPSPITISRSNMTCRT